MNPQAMLLTQYWKAEQERRRELIAPGRGISGGTTVRRRLVARITRRLRPAAIA